MQDKIPTWVLIGAVVLAFCAGILNTTALMGFTHVSASHVTGNVSQVAVSFFHGDIQNLQLFLLSIFSYWGKRTKYPSSLWLCNGFGIDFAVS